MHNAGYFETEDNPSQVFPNSAQSGFPNGTPEYHFDSWLKICIRVPARTSTLTSRWEGQRANHKVSPSKSYNDAPENQLNNLCNDDRDQE